MARTGGNLSELKPVKNMCALHSAKPVLSTPPIFITEKQTRNINKQLYAKSILKHNVFVSFYLILADNLFTNYKLYHFV